MVHLDELRHPRHRLDVVRLDADPGQVLQGAGPDGPCPGKVQMGCCQGAKLGEECPCPEPKRMGCYPDVECPCRQGLEALERRPLPLEPLEPPPQGPQVLLELEWKELVRLELLPLEQRVPLGQVPLGLPEQLALPGLEPRRSE